MLTKAEQILAIEDMPYEDVPVPEWKDTVRIVPATVIQLHRWRKSMLAPGTVKFDEDRAAMANILLLAMCIVDESGNPLFREDQVSDLAKKSPKAMSRIAVRARIISGIDDEAVDAAEKNSEPIASDSSISG